MGSTTSSRYAILETKDLVETHRLVDRVRAAEVALAPIRGGMVTRFRIGGDDLLFLDQATLRDLTQNVRGGIPVLFPIAGRLTGDAFMLAGRSVAMAQHGFARKLPWHIHSISTNDEAAVTLVLEHSEATLAQWPFPFRLTYGYQLRDAALTISQRAENLGDRPMPIHPGLHPYFRLDDSRKREARVPTAATRAFNNSSGAIEPVVGPLSFGTGETNLQLLDHGDPRVRLERPGAQPIELFTGDAATVIVLWSLPGRDFVCVEPWSTQSDAINRGQAIWVPPGKSHQTALRISREDA